MSNTKLYKSLLKYAPQKGLILDAGCGYFVYTNFLKNYTNKIICIDIFNLDMTEAKNNDFLLVSIEYLPFKTNSFDFIYCLSVLQLIKDDEGVINEFNRILKKNSRLLFTVPTSKSIFRLLRDVEIACGVYRYPEFNVKHYHYYTRRKLQNIINTKFKLIELYGYTYNFVPRLISFLLSILKLEPIFKSKKSRLGRKIAEEKNIENRNLSICADTKFDELFEFFRNRLKFISDFSYHYVVVLEKM